MEKNIPWNLQNFVTFCKMSSQREFCTRIIIWQFKRIQAAKAMVSHKEK